MYVYLFFNICYFSMLAYLNEARMMDDGFQEKCLKTHLKSDETAHSVKPLQAHGQSDCESLLEGPLLEIKCSAYGQAFVQDICVFVIE